MLQEREFERLGSARTIADRSLTGSRPPIATWPQMVEEHEFRADLFYRLNVFPVTRAAAPRAAGGHSAAGPSLFVQQFARRMCRQIEDIDPALMRSLMNYSWPGNVRELQNVMERAVILSPGPVLGVSLLELMPQQQDETPEPVTLRDAERAHIVRILRECDGVLAAAASRFLLNTFSCSLCVGDGIPASAARWEILPDLGVCRPMVLIGGHASRLYGMLV